MKKCKLLSLVSAAALLLTVVLGAIGGGVLAADLPGGATIAEGDPKLVLAPGVRDYVIGTKSAKQPTSYFDFYYTDYAEPYYYTMQADAQVPADESVYASAPNYGNYYGRFMGEMVYGKYDTVKDWAANGVIYTVQPDTYVALALLGPKGKAKFDPESYIYEYSTDGTNWSPLEATVSLEFDAADAVVAATYPNAAFSTWKAVVKIPAGDANGKLRVIMPGGQAPDYYWYTGSADIHGCLGGAVASAYDLTQYKLLSEVPEFKTPVLAPGVYDDFSTDYYHEKYIRSTWKDANDYNWNTVEGHASYVLSNRMAWGDAWPQLLGRFMGVAIENVYASNAGWNGSSLIYEVVPNSYIATAISTTLADDVVQAHIGCFGFEASADKTTWTALTPTLSLSPKLEGDATYFTAYKVVVQIPEGMKYYRITLPGYNKAATNGNEMTWGAGDRACEAGFNLGGSLASVYDLTQYDDMTKVPDSPTYVNLKEKLTEAITRADVIDLNLYKADDAAAAFVAKLAEAKAYAEEDHTLEEYDAMADALNAARAALSERGVPSDATLGQDDEKLILKPGVMDSMIVSAFLDEAGDAFAKTDGASVWYGCYTDYGKVGMISVQDNLYLTPYKQIHATSYDFFHYEGLQQLNFMGDNIDGVYIDTADWGGLNVTYKVYAGSYVSTAIVVNSARANKDLWPDVQNSYTFQVSADGENWIDIDYTVTALEPAGNLELYKADAKIPEGNYFLRIIMPGSKNNQPEDMWYPDGPGYNSSFLGPIVASMYDLSQYTNYADVPDATAWYVDAAIASTDTEKLQITDSYFKAMEKGMTVADALALLDTTNGGVQFYDADGNAITDTATVLAVGMKADILDVKGLSMSAGRGVAMLEVSTGNDLLSIGSIEDIVLDYGVDKTVEGLTLPTTVKIEAGTGTFDANIQWDLDGCEFDPAVTQTQEFTVSGTVVLPEGVENGGNMDLTVTASVLVNGSTDYGVASKDETKVKVDVDNQYVYVKEGMTVAELMEVLTPVGDVEVFYSDAAGNEIEDTAAALEEGMTVDVYTDVVMIGCFEVQFMTAEEESSEPEGPSDVEDPSDPENPDTGVPVALMPVVLAALGGAALVTTKKRSG